jgi:hypothetical protein
MEFIYLKGGLKWPKTFGGNVNQRPTYSEIQIPRGTKFCKVASNIFVFLVWNLLPVTFLEPEILKWLLDA